MPVSKKKGVCESHSFFKLLKVLLCAAVRNGISSFSIFIISIIFQIFN